MTHLVTHDHDIIVVIGVTHARHTTMRAAVARPAVSSAGVAGVASRATPDSRRLPPRRALPPHQSVAYAPEYGDRTYDEHTRLAFSSGDAFVADVEQSRVLWDDGWDVLDVRASQEIEHFGRFPNPPPGTIGGVFETVVVSGPHKVREVPLVTSSGYRFDPAFGAKVFADKTKNAAFLESVDKHFPDKANARIMVCCSDGRQRAVAALEALESAGYANLVLMQGGFNLYNRHWTKKLNRRLPNGNFKTDLSAPGDIQGCGANPEMGNANDAIAFGPWVDDTDWKTALG